MGTRRFLLPHEKRIKFRKTLRRCRRLAKGAIFHQAYAPLWAKEFSDELYKALKENSVNIKMPLDNAFDV